MSWDQSEGKAMAFEHKPRIASTSIWASRNQKEMSAADQMSTFRRMSSLGRLSELP
jgi:hypothetical protein